MNLGWIHSQHLQVFTASKTVAKEKILSFDQFSNSTHLRIPNQRLLNQMECKIKHVKGPEVAKRIVGHLSFSLSPKLALYKCVYVFCQNCCLFLVTKLIGSNTHHMSWWVTFYQLVVYTPPLPLNGETDGSLISCHNMRRTHLFLELPYPRTGCGLKSVRYGTFTLQAAEAVLLEELFKDLCQNANEDQLDKVVFL